MIGERAATYHVARADKPPVIDGAGGEWADIPAMTINAKAQSKGKWAGPEDLSGTLRILWDQIYDFEGRAIRHASNPC